MTTTITPPPRSITEYPLRSVTIVAKDRDDPLWVVLDAVVEWLQSLRTDPSHDMTVAWDVDRGWAVNLYLYDDGEAA